MRVIVVSGTPGTGKTTVARQLAKLKRMDYVDVNALIREKSLSDSYDKERDCLVVDINMLNSALLDEISRLEKAGSRGVVIDSHLSHYLPSSHVDVCIITKCELGVLKKRLTERGYSETKVRENLDAEIFDTCRVEASENGHKVITIHTDREYDLSKI